MLLLEDFPPEFGFRTFNPGFGVLAAGFFDSESMVWLVARMAAR